MHDVALRHASYAGGGVGWGLSPVRLTSDVPRTLTADYPVDGQKPTPREKALFDCLYRLSCLGTHTVWAHGSVHR